MHETIRKQKIAIIGATGSVGTSVLNICRQFPEYFEITALAAYENESKLRILASEFNCKKMCLTSEHLHNTSSDIAIGVEHLTELVQDDSVDQVVFASSGVNAIKALQSALIAGKTVSLANKESIVVAGPWVMPLVKDKYQLRPVDSEHSAVWQCIRDCDINQVEKIWLTASGGPFLNLPREEMDFITPERTLNHPVWKMGPKITIDSATLMNKGIECIEAMQLFNLSPDKVGAYIHPGSKVHGLAMFKDTTVKLLFSPPDMKLPAAAAMAYPDRLDLISKGFDISYLTDSELKFMDIDTDKFPCFNIAMDAAKKSGAYPSLLVGADEVAVYSFIEGRIGYKDIPDVINETLSRWNGISPSSLEDVIALVDEGKRIADGLCHNWR